MKYNKYFGMMIVAAGVLSATSCSDFNDYNEDRTDVVTPSANKTLWNNICENEQLSSFRDLVKRAGYDDELNSSQCFTVWAPVNSALDMSLFEGVDSTQMLEQFVKNHIAMYNFPLSGDVEERVHTLNKKSYDFLSANNGSFDGFTIVNANQPSNNGVLHTLNGMVRYYPNIYDYFFLGMDALDGQKIGLIGDSDNSYMGQKIDSIASYFKKYELKYLDVENSVVGPIVDGKQTYIDSVIVTNNILTNSLGRLSDEDSSYTFIIPSNEAWTKQYKKIKSHFNILKSTVAQDLTSSTSTTGIKEVTATVDNVQLSDSLTRITLVNNLVFSNNNHYNKWVVDNSQCTDTIYTTKRTKLSNPKEILAQTTKELAMSNGIARIVDSLAAYSWETYSPELRYRGIVNVKRVLSGTQTRATLVHTNIDNNGNEYQENLSISWARPSGQFSKPEVDVVLPNALSTTYNIYCVLANPSLFNGEENKPNQLNFVLNYCNAKGVTANWNFSSNMAENPKTQVPFVTNVESDVDTVFIGKFTFPVSYAGLSSDYSPNIKITSPFSMFGADKNKYSRDICLIDFILRPVEKDEFEAKKQ